MNTTSPLEFSERPFHAHSEYEQGRVRNYNGWLHVLEQAQWEYRQRYVKAESKHDSQIIADVDNQKQRAGKLEFSAKILQEGHFFGFDRMQVGSDEKSGGLSVGLQIGNISTSRVSNAGSFSVAVPPSVLEGASMEGADQNSAELSHSSKWFSARGEPQQWSTQRLHTFLDGMGLHIWIRDVNQGSLSGLKLISIFRRQLMETGVGLASLTLNGHPVKLLLHSDS